jgi:hypothetical protein
MAIATEIFANENRTVEREMTAEELADIAAIHEASQARRKIEETKLKEKETARQAVLDRLGITAEEAQLILGGSN